jgi:hypothetical protein
MSSDPAGRRLPRICAIYFVASIVVPMTAPFQAVNFNEALLSARSSRIAPRHRVAPAAAASKDSGLAFGSVRRVDTQSPNRAKSAGESALTIRRDRRAGRSSWRTGSAGSTLSDVPLTTLRI